MPHSRAYWVLIVGIGILTICEPYTTKIILPMPIDGVVDVVWIFVQGAAAFSLGADVYGWLRQWKRRSA